MPLLRAWWCAITRHTSSRVVMHTYGPERVVPQRVDAVASDDLASLLLPRDVRLGLAVGATVDHGDVAALHRHALRLHHETRRVCRSATQHVILILKQIQINHQRPSLST